MEGRTYILDSIKTYPRLDLNVAEYDRLIYVPEI